MGYYIPWSITNLHYCVCLFALNRKEHGTPQGSVISITTH